MTKTKKILIAFSVLLLVFAVAGLARNLIRDYQDQKQIEELALQLEEIRLDAGGDARTPPLSIKQANKPAILPEFQELYERNTDMIGWLTIDNTRIDFPVMQNPQDGEYYLNHDFDKKKNKNGLPFLDAQNRIDDSDILLLHGHNMKSGLMFADLLNYKQESYYKEHSSIRLDTLYEKAEYEIVAVILSEVFRKSDDVFKYYQVEKVGSPAEFDSYVQNIRKLALYDTGVTAEYGDRLIVLSTCEYSTENGRLAVVARKR
ncbi:class B sortase [Cohnella herbarum]|uniref:Class B sortase n=1 Tax=Cohnella herbarum TaxID=2728023 RepID=A0A7Z2ZN13_9BACL|nr:class B sortase [Cohnella herbarum]QJD85609.1 class B sortase [Cohnella herbarum]